MAVENPFAPICIPLHATADAGNHRGTDGDVWDEMPVHDVNVKPVCPVVLDDPGTFVREVTKIGGED